MDKHNKHSKNKNKGVNKPASASVSGSGLLADAPGVTGAAPAAKVQPKTASDKRK